MGHQRMLFHYRKRRYRCPHCGKRFYEPNSFVSRYHRMSFSLVRYLLDELQDVQPVKTIAAHCSISATTVNRVFSYISFPTPKLPKVLGIDESKGHSGGEKFQCILTDPEHHRVLDIRPGRQSHYLTSYFRSFSKEERSQVHAVVMDMTNTTGTWPKASSPRLPFSGSIPLCAYGILGLRSSPPGRAEKAPSTTPQVFQAQQISSLEASQQVESGAARCGGGHAQSLCPGRQSLSVERAVP